MNIKAAALLFVLAMGSVDVRAQSIAVGNFETWKRMPELEWRFEQDVTHCQSISGPPLNKDFSLCMRAKGWVKK